MFCAKLFIKSLCEISLGGFEEGFDAFRLARSGLGGMGGGFEEGFEARVGAG